MPAEFIVRVATSEDEPPVSKLLEASYPVLMGPSYDRDALAAALPLLIRANPALLSSGTFYLAASEAGRVVGCGGWGHERPGSGEVSPELAHLRHFATHPDWVGRGIGRAIYARCEAEARFAGVRRFECHASLNAERFYVALGFRPVRPMEVALGPDLTLPGILMTRPIRAPERA